MNIRLLEPLRISILKSPLYSEFYTENILGQGQIFSKE
jgi:hypothetical protein